MGVAEDKREDARELDPSSTTILVVDDLEQIRELVRSELEAAGYNVLQAHNGAAALLAAMNHPGRIDLLLTDVQMPGMNGRELAKWTRAQCPGISVLYMTGDPGDVFGGQEVEGSMESFLNKPFDRQTLLLKVRNALSRPIAGPGQSSNEA